jgi:hypothetical protein
MAVIKGTLTLEGESKKRGVDEKRRTRRTAMRAHLAVSLVAALRVMVHSDEKLESTNGH